MYWEMLQYCGYVFKGISGSSAFENAVDITFLILFHITLNSM